MKKIKNIKKELNDFLKDESGKMSKDNILKIGLGALGSVAAIAMFSPEASAEHQSVDNRYIVLKQTSRGAEYDEWAPGIHEDHSSHDEEAAGGGGGAPK